MVLVYYVCSSEAMTESELLANILDAASKLGWLAFHPRPARVTRRGVETWETAYSGNKGYPDITLARNGDVVMAELKSETGKVTPEQQAWLDATGGYLWRPGNWLSNEIIERLE